MTRRQLLSSSSMVVGMGLLASLGFGGRRNAAAAESALATFPVVKTDDEWRRVLTPDQFAVLRQEATERPFTSSLLHNDKHGTYTCAGCNNGLYASDTKFDSGTGWPSFWQEIDGRIGTTTDYKLIMARTEVHCANCGGHLGHVFDDGPAPTGKRHCINGIALGFQANDGAAAG